jgi:outer membrane receptor protein involved in Fe transport
VDHFSREGVGSDGSNVSVTGLKTTPDTTYRNVGWFNQLEFARVSWLRLTGGFRLDNWRSEAVPSGGYPPPSELYVLDASLPQILADPGALDTTVLAGLEDLLNGSGSLTSSNTVATANVGATLLLGWGVHPYLRFATSYREPEVTVRYGIRNFGTPTLSGQAIPNTELKPERGRNLDIGLKLARRNVHASLGYYRNDLSGFSSTVSSPVYAIPANPALGLLPTPMSGGSHLVQHFQRVTGAADVHFRGWEGSLEASLGLGGKGSLTPFVSLSWMNSVDDAPSPKDVLIVERYYNRSDTPIRLEGSVDEIPARAHPKSLGTLALRYTTRTAKCWVEYEWRFAGRITNTDPESVLAAVTPYPTQYGILKSLDGYQKHSLRGGLRVAKDGRLRLSMGIENLYDALFFLPYQTAPAPGRTLVLGLTLDMQNVLGR